MLNHSTDSVTLTEQVKQGKRVWEKNSCINCHTILGEGAYFAPELGNVWTRYGGRENPEGARAGLKGWIRAQPLNIPGRRVMPKFNLSEEELDALVSFLQWTDSIDTQGWPPTKAG
jgi:nitric oxide reductase subunit C